MFIQYNSKELIVMMNILHSTLFLLLSVLLKMSTQEANVNSVIGDNSIDDNNDSIGDILGYMKIKINKAKQKVYHRSLREESYPLNKSPFFQINPIPQDDEMKLNYMSEVLLECTKNIKEDFLKKFRLTEADVENFINSQEFKITNKYYCYENYTCKPDIYRSLDGSCNNDDNPQLGKINTPYSRMIPPQYSDGVFSPRKSVTGEELPSPRKISTMISSSQNLKSSKYTDAMVSWGQYLAHDTSCRINYQTEHDSIECCTDTVYPKEKLHHACMPVIIPDDDYFYSYFKQKCMTMIRSFTIPRQDCGLGAAEQLNACTSYIDASAVYGKTPEIADSLREHTFGKLKVSKNDEYDFLPDDESRHFLCDSPNSTIGCFKTGDLRSSRNPHVTALHAVFLREHNRIARALYRINPLWTDDMLYQEARRIVIAEIQHITYHEWLPIILGRKYTEDYITFIGEDNMFSRSYNTKIDGGTLNEFVHGAFRFFHTSVTDHVNLCPYSQKYVQKEKLSEHFNRNNVFNDRSNFDNYLLGLATEAQGESDPYFSDEMTKYLFKSDKPFGADIVSIDIHRGRDHGIANYNAYRKLCGLKVANSFNDLEQEISEERINWLKSLYKDVNDIDLYVGGLLENLIPGTELGPTFHRIFAEQFYRFKIGDKYFYDNILQPYPFRKDQLEQIKNVTLARLFCDNGFKITRIQARVFELISPNNPIVECDELPKVELKYWKDSIKVD